MRPNPAISHAVLRDSQARSRSYLADPVYVHRGTRASMDRRPFRRATFRCSRGRPIVSRGRRGGNSGKLVGRGTRGREAIRRATALRCKTGRYSDAYRAMGNQNREIGTAVG